MAPRREHEVRRTRDILTPISVTHSDILRSIFEEIAFPHVTNDELEDQMVGVSGKIDFLSIKDNIRLDFPRKDRIGKDYYYLEIEQPAQGRWSKNEDFSVAWGKFRGSSKYILVGSVYPREETNLFLLNLGDFPGRFPSEREHVGFWVSFNSFDPEVMAIRVGSSRTAKLVTSTTQSINTAADLELFSQRRLLEIRNLVNDFK